MNLVLDLGNRKEIKVKNGRVVWQEESTNNTTGHLWTLEVKDYDSYFQTENNVEKISGNKKNIFVQSYFVIDFKVKVYIIVTINKEVIKINVYLKGDLNFIINIYLAVVAIYI